MKLKSVKCGLVALMILFLLTACGDDGGGYRDFIENNGPPAMSIDNQTVTTSSTSFTLTGTIDDGATLTADFDTTATAAVVINGTSWTCSVTGLVEGANVVTITGTSSKGYSVIRSAIIICDTTLPTVTINLQSPTSQSSQVISGTISGTGTAVTAVTVSVDSAADQAATIVNTAWSYSVSGLTEGVHSVVVSAFDAVGNTISISGSITVDQNAPTLSLNPVATPTATNTQVLAGFVADDLSFQVFVDVNGAGQVEAIYPTATTWSYTATLSEGTNEIGVVTIDSLSQSSQLTTSIVYDATAPTVTATSPVDTATDIDPASSITVLFDEAVDPSTIDTFSFTVEDSTNVAATGAITYNAATFTATFTPDADLFSLETYTVTVSTAVTDVVGISLSQQKIFTFDTSNTVAPPPPPPGM